MIASCRSLVVVATGALLSGCLGAGSLPGAGAQPIPARPVNVTSAVATSAESRPSCAGRSPQPKNTTWTVQVAGQQRRFVVHVPPQYDPSRGTPVVLDFHGYRMSPELQEWLTGMSAKSDAAAFILVYPEGTGAPRSFDAGGCCGDAVKSGIDDVAFTRAMLDRLEADLCVDPLRVYATGMSNGGFMSHRLACEMSDRIAAVAPVSGVNTLATCAPTRAVSVLDFHGTADPTVPYAGGTEFHWPSAQESTNGWIERDGCEGAGAQTIATGDVSCVTHDKCRGGAEVELCTIRDGGHTWPGGKDLPFFIKQGHTTHAVDANDLIWSFFQKHPMPASVPTPR